VSGGESESLASAVTDNEAQESDRLASSTESTAIFNADKEQPLRAELVGFEICNAGNATARDHAPVLAICRELVAAGYDPRRALHAYRGQVLCLSVRSIGEGARLTVADDRLGRPKLRRWKAPPSDAEGPPVAVGSTDDRS